MSDGHRLVQAMRKAGQTPQNEVVDLILGKVVSVKPLKISIEERELSESFLTLGALCQETHIYTDNIKKLNHSHELDGTKTTTKPKDGDYDILLWRGLKKGDQVLMLKVGRGQKYFVLQRVEGVI